MKCFVAKAMEGGVVDPVSGWSVAVEAGGSVRLACPAEGASGPQAPSGGDAPGRFWRSLVAARALGSHSEAELRERLEAVTAELRRRRLPFEVEASTVSVLGGVVRLPPPYRAQDALSTNLIALHKVQDIINHIAS